MSCLCYDRITNKFFDLGKSLFVILVSLPNDNFLVFLGWHKTIKNLSIDIFCIRETECEYVKEVLAEISKAELINLLLIAILERFVQDTLQSGII